MSGTSSRPPGGQWNGGDPASEGGGDGQSLAAGTILGRYEIVRLLGRGGMGSVYEAVHRDLKKRVAIKTLLPSLAIQQEAKARFLREGEAASRIRHPHVVDITDVVADGPTSYLVMEFLEGEDLSKLLGRRGALGVAHTVDIMLPVMAAIGAAHEQGVIHRDLKPENIFLSRSMYGGLHPKVFDFGISKVLNDGRSMALTGTAATFGTTYYLPPEQLRGARQADGKSDQYALGTILYECLTGHRAFEGDNLYAILRAIGDGEYTPPRARRPDLPAELEAIIVRAMSLDPGARYASVQQLGAALLPFASPGARANWTPLFSGVGADDGAGDGDGDAGAAGHGRGPGAAASPVAPRTGEVGRTMVLPDDAAAAPTTGRVPARSASGRSSSARSPSGHTGGARPAATSSSTLRDATGEAQITSVVRGRSRAPIAVGIVATVAAAAVLTLVALRPGHAPAPAPAADPGAEAPQPPASLPAPPAVAKSPVAAPAIAPEPPAPAAPEPPPAAPAVAEPAVAPAGAGSAASSGAKKPGKLPRNRPRGASEPPHGHPAPDKPAPSGASPNNAPIIE